MSGLPRERERPYDRSEPSLLGAVLSDLFAMRGYGRVQASKQLDTMWQQIAGDEITGQSKAIEIKNGVLHVGVTNSALLSELVAFHRQPLLERVQSEFAHLRVKDIKFKLRR